MPRTPQPKLPQGGGPTKVHIDWDQFDKLCALSCTMPEIAGYFNCSHDTILRAVKEHTGMPFASYFKQKEGTGHVALRRTQMQVALAGNVTMLIWLGKQKLGQSDKVTQIPPDTEAKHLSTEQISDLAEEITARKKARK